MYIVLISQVCHQGETFYEGEEIKLPKKLADKLISKGIHKTCGVIMKIEKINDNSRKILKELLLLEINDEYWTREETEEQRQENKKKFNFKNYTHFVNSKYGAFMYWVKGDLVESVGLLSNGINNVRLLLDFIKLLDYLAEEFRVVYFYCNDTNDKLSNLMKKDIKQKIICKEDKTIYYKYTKGENSGFIRFRK